MRLAFLAAALVLALTGLASAQAFDTPEAMLEAFYEPYFTGEFHQDEAPFRSAALQALYDYDAELTPEGEMGAFSFDPYIDGQDFDISNLVIGPSVIDGGYASVDVTFENFGQLRVLIYDVVYEDGGWRIDDVVSESPDNVYRLSEIFASSF